MKRRQYLTEDLEQIQRYFPGAEPVALHTPFDITPRPRRLAIDLYREEPSAPTWRGKLRWTI
ncbi:hypothetical protein JNM87_02205 [Candidatus Saccharibacteria bacterium]|nr:hypothetical protein [Candidatus Saccharibacteria bacterium]